MRVQQIQHRLSLEGRYASALYCEAVEKNAVGNILHEATQFNHLLTNNHELLTIFSSQLITQKIMIKILSDIQQVIKFSELFLQFLIILTKNKRLMLLPEIFKAFELIVDNALNTIHAKVEITKYNKEHQLTIEQMITKKYPKQNIKYSYNEVPELLGGFRVFINKECLDYSLISRLNRLRNQLKKA